MSESVKIKSYSKKELRGIYGVSEKTLGKWLALVPDLGEYTGKRYLPKQVEKIFNHLGMP